LTKHVREVSQRQKKAIKILNTKIPTDPYKTAIIPVGIPYSLQKPKNPYRRDFSLRVATLARTTACTPINKSHEKVKLLKSGKRSDACLRRFHVVTSFDPGLEDPRYQSRVKKMDVKAFCIV